MSPFRASPRRKGWLREKKFILDLRTRKEKALDRFQSEQAGDLHRLALALTGDAEQAQALYRKALERGFPRSAERREEMPVEQWLAARVVEEWFRRSASPRRPVLPEDDDQPLTSGSRQQRAPTAAGSQTPPAASKQKSAGRRRKGRSRERAGPSGGSDRANNVTPAAPPPRAPGPEFDHQGQHLSRPRDLASAASDAVARARLGEEAGRAAATLTDGVRAAWVLSDVLGRTPESVAGTLDLSVSVALTRIHTARLTVADALLALELPGGTETTE